MLLVSQAILQNHVILWSFEYMGNIQSGSVVILPGFVALGIVVVEI